MASARPGLNGRQLKTRASTIRRLLEVSCTFEVDSGEGGNVPLFLSLFYWSAFKRVLLHEQRDTRLESAQRILLSILYYQFEKE